MAAEVFRIGTKGAGAGLIRKDPDGRGHLPALLVCLGRQHSENENGWRYAECKETLHLLLRQVLKP